MSVVYVDGTTPLDAAHMNGLLQRDNVATVGTRILASNLALADTQPSFRVLGSGEINWGPGGSTAVDVQLRRTAAKSLAVGSAAIPTCLTIYSDNTVWPFVVYMTSNS